MSAIVYRAMAADDLPAVMAVQLDAYGADFVEDGALLAQRFVAASRTAWVAVDHRGVCAYLVAYPSRRGSLTALGAGFRVAARPDCLYLHDLAVAFRIGGKGVGPGLVRHAHAFALSAGLSHTALVSVQSSRPFWMRQGYVDATPAAAEAGKLGSYPGEAHYMVRATTAG